MKQITFISLFLITALVSFSQSKPLSQTVKGNIVDDQSGNVLHNVSVIVDGIKPLIASISDSVGNFKLLNVPIGRQNIKISFVGYEESVVRNIEVTSSKEVILEIRLKEKIKLLNDVVVVSGKQKNRAINETAVVSARQLSIDEAVRYSGTRNDPSRMAQNFAGVSGTNDARNDIVIRGNSPTGVLWRMDGIDIPNPNHFSTMGATGGPVTMLNTNTLKNSDFITSAFPAQYGNAIAGIFDLRLRNGNAEKNEYLGQMGFNGFEFGAEGPLQKQNKSSFLINYRYSMVAAIQSLGLSVGTGTATPYYQDASFKLHINTKNWGTFDVFGLGGESHINFPPDSSNTLYGYNDGKQRDMNSKSLTGVVGITNTYFFNTKTSGKIMLALSSAQSKYFEQLIQTNIPNQTSFNINNIQTKLSLSYLFNTKINSKNQFTSGVTSDINFIKLKEDYLPNGISILTTLTNSKNTATLLKFFTNYNHRFSNTLSTNLGIYSQWFDLNNSFSIEPRWNIKYQLASNQSVSIGAGLHSQTQPLEVYFYQSKDSSGNIHLTNKNLDFVKSIHTVLGYDYNISRYFRFKTEIYYQYLYNAAVESASSSFSMLNYGANFGLPDKFNLTNKGIGYNYGIELTAEKFLHKGVYYLFTASVFESKYKGSDNVLRNTVFSSNYVTNLLGGKEFKINEKTSFGIDSKITIAGGQRYTPFDIAASLNKGYMVFKDEQAFSLQNSTYFRWDLKFSYTKNAKKSTQKWYIDFQNITNQENIFWRSLNTSTGKINEIYQMGFFPNINYNITF